MDTARGFEEDRIDHDSHEDDAAVDDHAGAIGTDERRMHVRAYNHWVSLLDGRAYPSIEDLDPDSIADFGPNSVLLDFTAGLDDPHIQFLGRELREECALDSSVASIAAVPSRSLLSRLTDHYLQIIANRAPIGFEAEFVGSRGNNTLYRGILMPFSSDGEAIDFIYGVINWKELVDAETQARLDAEVDESIKSAPARPAPTAPVWADGPGFSLTEDSIIEDEPLVAGASLADQLMLARQTAAAASAADTRSRAALYRALGRAYDFALAIDGDAQGYADLLHDAGLTVQARAPMTPVVKLVFGVDYDKTRLTEFATVLTHARRTGIAAGGLADLIDQTPGGIKALVKAEREARRPKRAARPAADRARLAERPALASVPVPTSAAPGAFVVLLARATEAGTLDIVASVESDAKLTEQAIRAAAG